MERKINLKNILNSLGILFILLFIFFCDFRQYIFKSTIIAYAIFAIGISTLILLYIKRTIKVDKTIILWLLTFVFVGFSIDKGYIFKYILGILLMVIFSNNIESSETLFKYLKYLGIFFSICSFLFFIFPDVYIDKVTPYLDSYMHETAIIMAQTKRVTGFTGHYSTNGTYLSIGLGATLALLLSRDKKEKKNLYLIFLLIIGALLIIGKRAHLIFSIISCFLVYWIYNSERKRTRMMKVVLIIVSLLTIFAIMVGFIPALGNTFNRFNETAKNGDFLMSRGDFYKVAFSKFKESPIIGIGWKKMVTIINHDVHNVYIQLLAETGVVGFIVYISIFTYCYIITIRNFYNMSKNKKNYSSNDIACIIFSFYYQTFFLIYSLTGNPLYDEQPLFIYFISYGMALYMNEKIKRTLE